jgi:hypothetical protein
VSGDVAVYVVVGERGLLAGRLYPHRRGAVESASFVYDDRYLADPDAYAPDRWGRTLIKRAEISTYRA